MDFSTLGFAFSANDGRISSRKATSLLLQRVVHALEPGRASVDDLFVLQEEVNKSWLSLRDDSDPLIDDAHHFITHYISDIDIRKSTPAFKEIVERQVAEWFVKLSH